jgi:hypothetical protein
MASVESNKKVARAAKAGGGRTRRQTSTSWGYYGTLIGIAVVGTGLITSSWWDQREDPGVPYLQTEARSTKELKLRKDALKKYKGKTDSKEAKAAQARYDNYVENNHIHAAYAVWDCTKDAGKEWLPPVNGEPDVDRQGIHAHADGLIHAHPFAKSVTGRRAKLGKFFEVTGLKVSGNAIVLPSKPASEDSKVPATKGATLKAGTKCKSGKPAEIAVWEYSNAIVKGAVNKNAKPKRLKGSPADVRINKQSAYAFAMIEKGKIPAMPPTVQGLVAPSDQIGATGTPTAPPISVETPPIGSTIKGATTIKGVTTVKGATTVAPATTKATPPTTAASVTTVKK